MSGTHRLLALLAVCSSAAFAWWDFWPYTEHQDLMSRSIEICAARYPEMADEVQAYADELRSGTHDEDFDSDEVNGAYTDYSGLCPALPDAWWPTARRRLNAVRWVHDSLNPNNWNAAVARYQTSRSDAYYMLGHVLHNLQDAFVPAHSHISPHGTGTSGLVENHSWPGYFDNFEQWCEVTENELNRASPALIPEQTLDTLMFRAASLSSTDVESLGFLPSQYCAPPDTAGGWGRYRPYPSGGYPCGRDRVDNDLANAWSLYLVPACCEYAAGALRAFYLACNPTAVREIPAALAASPLPFGSPLVSGVPLRSNCPARVSFYDVSGRPVAVTNVSATGRSTCPRLATGVYLYRLERSEGSSSGSVVVLGP